MGETSASLQRRAVFGIGALTVIMVALIFGVAGSVRYAQGWAYLAVFLGASILITIYLFRSDRALLERRLSGGPFAEERGAQRVIMTFATAGFIALIALPALDFRFDYALVDGLTSLNLKPGWTRVPFLVEAIATVLVAAGFWGIFVVYRANSFAAATVRIAQNQTVISTGPYAIVRHPMYATSLPMLVGTPLMLGSYLGLLPFIAVLPFLYWRLRDEERFLEQNLPGYIEYEKKVRWRIVPHCF